MRLPHLQWMLRAKRWVQRPPSASRVKLVFGVIAACLAIALWEHIFGWPDWLTVDRPRRP